MAIKTDDLKSILGTLMTEGEHHPTQVVLWPTQHGGGGHEHTPNKQF